MAPVEPRHSLPQFHPARSPRSASTSTLATARRSVVVGLYANSGGHPGRRTGFANAAVAEAWPVEHRECEVHRSQGGVTPTGWPCSGRVVGSTSVIVPAGAVPVRLQPKPSQFAPGILAGGPRWNACPISAYAGATLERWFVRSPETHHRGGQGTAAGPRGAEAPGRVALGGRGAVRSARLRWMPAGCRR